MTVRNWMCVALTALVAFPALVRAETVTGQLERVSFAEGVIVVSGAVYRVNTETTRVKYRGAMLSEEDLSKGDRVELILSDEVNAQGQRELLTVNILVGHKSGLES